MAKSRATQQPSPITELTVSKSEFKKFLNEQIEEGTILHKRTIITQPDLDIYKQDYERWTKYISEFLKHSFNKPSNEYKEAFNMEGYSFMGRLGTYANEIEDYKDLIARRLANLKNLERSTDFMKTSVLSNDNIETKKEERRNDKDKVEVFIVHGHDGEAKIKAARFIERLGLKPIILHEQASGGATIIEKIEAYTNVGFALVLYTPCDCGKKKDADVQLQDRARQNVVFEHGYLIGRIGRNNVCALVKGNVETPSDISGVVYTPMDENDAWHFSVAKELRKAGYTIDMNKI